MCDPLNKYNMDFNSPTGRRLMEELAKKVRREGTGNSMIRRRMNEEQRLLDTRNVKHAQLRQLFTEIVVLNMKLHLLSEHNKTDKDSIVGLSEEEQQEQQEMKEIEERRRADEARVREIRIRAEERRIARRDAPVKVPVFEDTFSVPSIATDSKERSTTYTCSYCGEANHNRISCPKRKRDEASTSSSSSSSSNAQASADAQLAEMAEGMQLSQLTYGQGQLFFVVLLKYVLVPTYWFVVVMCVYRWWRLMYLSLQSSNPLVSPRPR